MMVVSPLVEGLNTPLHSSILTDWRSLQFIGMYDETIQAGNSSKHTRCTADLPTQEALRLAAVASQ